MPPPVRGHSRRLRWAAAATLVVCGAIGGAATGALIASLGQLVGFSAWVPPYVPAAGLLVLAILDLARTRAVALRSWQVPVSWLHKGTLGDSAVWGLTLGPGILTYPGSNIITGLWLTVLLTQTPGDGAWLGFAYGASRMLALLTYRFVLLRRSSASAGDLQPDLISKRGVRLASALANACLAILLATRVA